MEIKLGESSISIETDKLAQTADSSCVLRSGDTVVLVTVCREWKEPATLPNFLPLTCDYLERKYAAGMIPGGFFKREGRPTEKEVLSSRLIDRPVRPLFPKGWRIPVQIVATVLSSDREHDGDILAMLGASCALRLSSIPFPEALGAVRVALIDNNFVVNPTIPQLIGSKLELTVAGTQKGITMIDGTCLESTETDVFKALEIAYSEIKKIIEFQNTFKDGTVSWTPKEALKEINSAITSKFSNQIEAALNIKERLARRKKLSEVKYLIISELREKYTEAGITEEFESIQENWLRNEIIKNKKRIDGRGVDDLREISCEVGMLPRAHGSAIFKRGETQCLCTVTLGTTSDEQKMEELIGESYKSFMVHYNFPPYSVGEVGRLSSPGRREIGHGMLAERALEAIIPAPEVFPYTIRIVSDILSSNGSSSMASVCGGSLALMDAGIPIKAHVGGVSIGSVDDVLLVDICGEEDHFGDMDFKAAGTKEGINSIQLDVKTDGISLALLEKALQVSKSARLKILDKLAAVLPSSKKEISAYAPKLSVVFIPKEKIGMVIGPGGKIIREIIEKTGAKVDINDDGKVSISSDSWQTTETAKAIVEGIVEDVKIGKTYIGKVKKIMPFGVFVELLPGKEGLIHISQLANYRVRAPEDEVKVGDEVPCKVIEIDDQGKIQLSRKALLPK